MLPKNYNPKESEPRWQQFWADKGVYRFDPGSRKKIFSIDTPPPTVSGKMHIGHSFSYAQLDFIARYHRMKGENVFYPFGTDDNGLATERLIEKMKNVRGQFMKRKEFVDLCLKTLEEIRPDIVDGWKRIGLSADFGIFYTTINEHCQKISQRSFLDIYKMGRIYRKKAPIMFCPSCLTAIAQVELKDAERESNLVYLKAKVDGTDEDLVFATTRPELIYGCVGISVHPGDKRYKHLAGKKVKIPLADRSVELIPDEFTDMEYGSGVVYYCTYGGVECIEWMMRHPTVAPIDVMGPDGRYNEKAGMLKGMKSEEARKKAIEELEKIGAIVKIEKIRHIVNAHERCDTDIEYVSTEQWYIRYLDLKDEFIKYGRKIKWYPEHMRARYENWISGLKWDWNISRQRHFGVPIPVWYCRKCNEVIIAEEKQLPVDPLADKPSKKCRCGSNEFVPEKDVLDTWATSSLTPDIAIELFADEELQKKLRPMSLRPQAHDIITFWLFNTVVKSYFHRKAVPWHNVMISGWALDPKGKKMSKSKGNVVEPQAVLEKYSADALRFWAASSNLGEDLPFMEKELVAGTKTMTKLWNASRFAIMNLKDYNKEPPKKLAEMDRWILAKLSRLVRACTDAFDEYEYSHAKSAAENFFWHDFADNYLEIVKDRMYNSVNHSDDEVVSGRHTVYKTLLTLLKLFAPLMPHVTEEIYQMYFRKSEVHESIHVSPWPSAEGAYEETAGDKAVEVIAALRKYKSGNNMAMNEPLKKVVISDSGLKPFLKDIKATMKIDDISVGSVNEGLETASGIKIHVE